MQVHASEQIVCECGKHRYSFEEFTWYDVTPDVPAPNPAAATALLSVAPVLARIAKVAGFNRG